MNNPDLLLNSKYYYLDSEQRNSKYQFLIFFSWFNTGSNPWPSTFKTSITTERLFNL